MLTPFSRSAGNPGDQSSRARIQTSDTYICLCQKCHSVHHYPTFYIDTPTHQSIFNTKHADTHQSIFYQTPSCSDTRRSYQPSPTERHERPPKMHLLALQGEHHSIILPRYVYMDIPRPLTSCRHPSSLRSTDADAIPVDDQPRRHFFGRFGSLRRSSPPNSLRASSRDASSQASS
jgi:hypothetical protein